MQNIVRRDFFACCLNSTFLIFLLKHLFLHLNKKCWHLPIFPGRHQPSIFGTIELNFRVRYGNGWTLNVFNTNFLLSNYITFYFSLQAFSLFFTHFFLLFFLLGVFPLHRTLGDSYGNRTRVSGVRGRRLNRLTNEPYLHIILPYFIFCK